ncbi:two-component system histidine kinase PnpS [Desulfotomaculum copahuensis]|uniref:Phosphate regulon sensor protein PhoR n=1 Tax=Desulfotomaculum copahuensis TaxID=1838280 RepID=A0A1B7LEX4_9FIRM|nr:phosphate regulon sensor histidine kinase PhoR [Desulfotomaculum copahuensis]OAT81786.1 phosphate regulon sensor histidine kinase PhoR [Desulfotomaculum copahuensis]
MNWKLPHGITWRPVASYFFMVIIFFALLQLVAAQKLNLTGALAVALLLSVVLAWLLYRRVVAPLSEINETAREMARGRLDRELHLYSRDEIGQLANSVNEMARQLRRTINQITEEKDRARAILNSMADGVIALDRQGQVLLVNPVVEEIFNIKQEDCQGKNILGVIRNFDLELLLERALKTQQPLTREIKIIAPEPRIFRLHATPLEEADREKGGVVVLLRDVTERKKLDDMRSEFVANVSHELRTPLTSIRGFLETLLDGALDDRETARHFLEIMSAETERLTRLIDDLLDLSKIEERRVVHRWQPVDMIDVISRVLSMFRPQAREKNITLLSRLPSGLPVVQGDPDMLAQVLINLVDNALKYTPGGGQVTVSAAAADGRLEVSVADTGVGIPAESLPRIFERFYRVDKARSRELGGIGIGLAIVKHIIRAHGGKIQVESTPGRGSVFSFTLPAGEGAATLM